MRRCGGFQCALNWLLGFGAVLGFASSAAALPQFVPTPGARLHTVTSGQPGATYNTQGAGDNVSYDSNSGLLSITGVIDEMNWYDPANGACASDSGSNCNLNYSPDLTLTVQAVFLGINAVNLGGGYFDVDVMFGPTGGVDILWSDPADGGSTQLAAMWQAGTFMGSPTTGLTASLLYDANANSVLGPVNAVGFASVDLLTPYASLYGAPGEERIELDIANLHSGVPDIGTLIAQAIQLGTLPSFTAEADGQVFRVAAGQFVVPEPSTALLVGLGTAGFALVRRTRRSA